MEIVALIPARGGSKRIPNKNFKLLNGKPLIEYSIVAAQATTLIDRVIVSSNCCPWVAKQYGVEYLDRPEEFCTDDALDYDVILHMLENVDTDCEAVVYLRPTTPFRTMYHIEQAIKHIREARHNATGLRSVEKMGESAFKCFGMYGGYLEPIDFDNKNLTDLPNQLCPTTYKPNGYVDICRPEVIAGGSTWGHLVIGHLTPHTIEIDGPDDWEYAEYLANRGVEFNFWTEEIT